MWRLFLVGALYLETTASAGRAKGTLYPRGDLHCGPAVRTFTGPALAQIALPLRGIGTGTVSLGGRGELRDWEIFNRPAKGFTLPFTFFAIYTKQGQAPARAKIPERRLLPPYTGAFGLLQNQLAGLPRPEEVTFRGEYPLAWIEFCDAELPVQVALEAWNPFIPPQPEESGLPLAMLTWKATNQTQEPVRVAVAANLSNPVGTDGGELGSAVLGSNVNEYVDSGTLRGLFLSKPDVPIEDLRYGSMALATPWPELDARTHWYCGGWWDQAHILWEDFSEDSRVQHLTARDPSPSGRSDVGSPVLFPEVAPGHSTAFPFIIAWYFPNRENYWNSEPTLRHKRMRNHYANRFANAREVAQYAQHHLQTLEAQTRAFHDALFGTTLPGYVLDAVASQASMIRPNTCLWLDDGSFFAFEGCGDASGCCPMNCTHDWNSEQALAFLFPSLERSMRRTDFLQNTLTNGYMTFRTLIPPTDQWWQFKACADGQMGTIVRAYREWKLSGDNAFLRELWPRVKAALEFAWKGCGSPPPEGFARTAEQMRPPCDEDMNGVMEGEQHNTYDIEFYGSTTMTGSLYLAALKAAAEMAEAMAERESARVYRHLFARGQAAYDAPLWNGHYYRQQVVVAEGLQVPQGLRMPPREGESGKMVPKYQYWEGCLSDQLLRQYLAHVPGLGHILPPEHVKTVIKSVFDYNWRRPLSDFSNVQRVYALNDESGLLLCSWPFGNRPLLPFVYSDEVWTGIEYQVASTLIYNGWVDEGLTIVKGARDRYEGVRRNPRDEIACGHHYARAMASWALLLALSGFSFDRVIGHMCFAPAINQEDFACFWSTGSAWGTFSQRSGIARVQVLHGSLALTQLSLGPAPLFIARPSHHLDGTPLPARAQRREGRLHLAFPPLKLGERQTMEVR